MPELRQVVLERRVAKSLGLHPGDPLTIEMDGGARYTLTVGGLVHDMTVRPYNLTGEAQGYVTLPTLEWMGEQPYYNRLQILVAENQNQPRARATGWHTGARPHHRAGRLPGGDDVGEWRAQPQPG